MIFHVSVRDRIATYEPQENEKAAVCENSGDTVEFSFDSEWQSHNKKTARFIFRGKYIDVEFVGNTCPVPIIEEANSFNVGVYVGEMIEDGYQLSSTRVTIPSKYSIRDYSKSAHDESGKNYTNEARGYAAGAKASAESAEKSATEAAESAESLAGVRKQVTKNAQDIAMLKEVSEGTLYTVDEDFPSYDGAGTDLLYPTEDYCETAFVTEIVVNNPQPNASYIGVEAWGVDGIGFVGLVEVPDYIRELLTYPKITDATLGTTSTYSLDLENKIRKQTYQTVNFDEYCEAFEYEEITNYSLLPHHVVNTVLNSSWDRLDGYRYYRLKEKASGAYVLDDPSVIDISDDDMTDVFGICGGYYLDSSPDRGHERVRHFIVDNLTIYKNIEVESAPIGMKLDIDLLRSSDWGPGEFYNGISDEDPRNYDFSDGWLLDQAGTHDNVPIIKAYVKL